MKWFSMQMCCLLVEPTEPQEICGIKEQKVYTNMNFNLLVTALWFNKLQLMGWVLEQMKYNEGLVCDWKKWMKYIEDGNVISGFKWTT